MKYVDKDSTRIKTGQNRIVDLTDSDQTIYFKYFTLILGGGAVLALTVIIFLDDSKNYTYITRDTEVSGRISNIKREHGVLFFNIQDSLKYSLSGHMANYAYSQDDLFFFLTGGDWLEKRKGTDTLMITRFVTASRSEDYLFVLGQELNKQPTRPDE